MLDDVKSQVYEKSKTELGVILKNRGRCDLKELK